MPPPTVSPSIADFGDLNPTAHLAALTRAQDLFTALLRVSARVHTAATPAQVMETLGAELLALGMHCAVLLLSEEGSDDGTSYLQAAYVSLDEAARRNARVAHLGQAEPLKMPLRSLPFWPDLIAGGEAVYFHSPTEVIEHFLPAPARAHARTLLQQAGVHADLKGALLLMRTEGKPLGLLAIWGPEIAPQDRTAMMLFADQIAAALEMSRLRQQQTAHRLRQQQALQRFSQALLEAVGPDAIFAYTLQALQETLQPDLCEILLPHPQGGLLLAAAHGWPAAFVGSLHIKKASDQSLAQFVLQEKKVVAVSDFAHETRFLAPSLFLRQGIRASLSAPMLVADQALGVVCALWRTPRPDAAPPEGDADQRLLSLIANSAAQALTRAQLLAAAQRNALEMAALYDTALALTAQPNLADLLPAIMRRAAELLGASIGALYLLDPQQHVLRMAVPYNLPPALDHVVLQLGEGISGRIAQSGQPMVIEDYETWPHHAAAYHGYPFHCVAAVPLIVRGQIIGVLNIASDQKNVRFGPEHLRLLQLFADHAAIAIENARLLESEQQQLRLTEALRQIGLILGASLDLETIFDRLLELIQRIIPLDGGCVFTVQEGIAKIARSINYQAHDQAVAQALQTLSLPVAATPNLRRVAEMGRALRIADTQADPDWVQVFPHSPFRSWLGAPILLGEEVIAFFSIEKIEPDFYQAHHAQALDLFSRQAAIALENARLFAAERQQLLLSQTLQALGALLTTEYTLSEVLDRTLTLLRQVVAFDSASIYLFDPAGHPRFYAGRGFADIQRLQTLMDSHGPAILARFHSHQIQVIADTRAEPTWVDMAETRAIRSWIGAPLLIKGQLIGALNVDSHQPHTFDTQIAQTVMAFANQAAVAIENARLFAEVQQRARHSETLNAIIAAAAAADDLQALLDATLPQLLQALAAPQGMIRIHGGGHVGAPTQGRPYVTAAVAAAGLPPACVDALSPLAAGPAPFDLDARLAAHSDLTYLHLPIQQQGQAIGDLYLGDTAPRSWTAAEIALAEAATRQLAAAAERISLLMQTQAQARLMQQLVDTVPEGVLWLDAQHRPALVNPAAAAMLHLLARYDAAGSLTHLGDVGLAQMLAPASQADVALAQGGRHFEIASRALTEGEEWVLVLRDVTGQRQQQEREQQRQRLVAVGQMAAGIAHDFNNILQGIIGFADLLQKREDMPTAARRHLQLLAEQGRRGAALVRQILDFSRQSVIDKRRHDLATLAQEAIALLHPSLPPTIHIELHSDPPPHPIAADPAQIQRLLTNLIFNARDAMPRGGAIRLHVQRLQVAAGAALPLPEMWPGDWVTLTVQDTGAGISPEVLPFIFEPFYTTKGASGGTGLGLAQVYGIMRQHDGFIKAHPTAAAGDDTRGACFTLYFPLAASTPADAAPLTEI